MTEAAMSVDELIAAAADRAPGVSDRLARLTAAAASAEHGVEVVVNLDGMIVGLELADRALRLGPDRLAAEIHRLTQQACESALVQGMDLLAPEAGPELMALIGPAGPIRSAGPAAPRPPEPPAVENEDFSAIESWALPR